jgi:hypothetical protein
VETLMHGSEAETGGAIPSPTVTGRGGGSGGFPLGSSVTGLWQFSPAAERERSASPFQIMCRRRLVESG